MDNNINDEIDKVLDEINLALIEEIEKENPQSSEKMVEQTEETTTESNGECWALVCYTEKTMFQKIVYNFKKLFKYTKERILGRA